MDSKPIGPVTIMALLNGFHENKVYNKKWKKPKTTTISRNLIHGSLYLYAMKSPVTREKYTKRLEKFFDSLGLDGSTIEEKSKKFVHLAKEKGNGWAFNAILRFMQFQLDRANRKEITGSTVRNYLKSIKLFCEMADFQIAWKKISRGLSRAKNYSDDRIPTIEEIRKLLEYPDRRLKSIIYTMASSGIRLGAWDYLKWGHIRPI